MKRKWVEYNVNGIRNDHSLDVKVLGVSIEGYLCEIVGENTDWSVHYRNGDGEWHSRVGTCKTFEAARDKAEATMERLVDRAIKGLQKWRWK